METFDLARLTDFDFEAVCKDLFEEEFGVPLEIFAPGADGGIDLRHFRGDDPAWIFQCKHWGRSTRSKLITHMRESELPKIQRLNPGRYVLAASVELTRGAKDSLFELLKPYVKSPGDIFGLQEMNALLRKHEHIVRRHMRLWLTSASVLSSLLSKSVVTRSQRLADELDQTLKIYAPNGSHERAFDLLESGHVCVVAGIPGIGKTTLAHVLCAKYVSSGFELVEISADAEEANSLWDDDVPQIFYYDDFLGQTALEEKLGKNEDGRLLSLMRRVADSSNKRFVLTTREYILAQARQRYERLDRHPFDLQTCVIDLQDYTYSARAAILYNHVYASPLPTAVKGEFADSNAYRPIIQHRNFNPRVIAATLAEAHAFSLDQQSVAAEILSNLESPLRVWGHIVANQLGDNDVFLLGAIFTFSGVYLEDLRECWVAQGRQLKDLRASIGVLDGTMLRSYMKGDRVFVDLHNPSVRDYMRDHLAQDPDGFLTLLRSVLHFEQISKLWVAAMGRGGSPLKELLVLYLGEFERIAHGALRSAGLRSDGVNREYDYAERVHLYLDMADSLGSAVLFASAVGILEEMDVISDAYDREDVIGILKLLYRADVNVDRRLFDSAVDAAVQWAMQDVTTWRDLLEAELMLSIDLGDITPESVQDDIAKRIDQYATYAFEDWAQEDEDPAHDLDEVLDMLEYYQEPARRPYLVSAEFEFVESRAHRMESERGPIGIGVGERSPGANHVESEYWKELVTVDRMMSSLLASE